MKADIMQMANQSGLDRFVCDRFHDDAFGISLLEHFAKLIAKQCADIADTAEPYKSADLIRKHFGVEYDRT
jgi:hypothetical protein